MKKFFFGNASFRSLALFLLLLLNIQACTGLKPLIPLDPARKPEVLEGCRRLFLPGKYRLVHALETVTPEWGRGTVIGVVVADPRTRHFRTVMMTIEGWVLFDAEAGERLVIHRAVPPFDKPAFAEGLAEDIRLALLPPDGEPIAWGADKGGAPVCRFERADGRLVEVMTGGDGIAWIRLYDAEGALRKSVSASRLEKAGLAETLEIDSNWPPYTLRLRLLESEALEERHGVNPEGMPFGAESSGPEEKIGKEK